MKKYFVPTRHAGIKNASTDAEIISIMPMLHFYEFSIADSNRSVSVINVFLILTKTGNVTLNTRQIQYSAWLEMKIVDHSVHQNSVFHDR